MGSILVFGALIVLKGIFLMVFGRSRWMKKFKKMRDFLNSAEYKQAVIRFLLESFFELVICSALGFKMLEVRQIWGTPEYVTFGI